MTILAGIFNFFGNDQKNKHFFIVEKYLEFLDWKKGSDLVLDAAILSKT